MCGLVCLSRAFTPCDLWKWRRWMKHTPGPGGPSLSNCSLTLLAWWCSTWSPRSGLSQSDPPSHLATNEFKSKHLVEGHKHIFTFNNQLHTKFGFKLCPKGLHWPYTGSLKSNASCWFFKSFIICTENYQQDSTSGEEKRRNLVLSWQWPKPMCEIWPPKWSLLAAVQLCVKPKCHVGVWGEKMRNLA